MLNSNKLAVTLNLKRARGMLEWMNHPQYGRIAAARSPLQFEGVPRMPLTASSKLGAQNAEVYSGWLGLSHAALKQLEKDGTI